MHARRLPVVLATLTAVLGLVACGDDDDSAATTATTARSATTAPGPVGSASTELCAARDDLRTSIGALAEVDVVRNGTSAVTEALGAIRDDLSAVRSQTGDDLRPQIDAFQQALDDLQTAVADPTAVRQVVGALRTAGTTGSTLVSSLGDLDCP